LALSLFIGLALASRLAAQEAPATGGGQPTQQADPGATQTITVTGERQESRTETRREADRYFDSHAVPTRSGQYARWHHPICVRTWGLPLELNARISTRIMDIAEHLGIAADRSDLCWPNVRIGFTNAPQAMIERAAARNRMIIGFHYASQRERMIRVRQPVQAWYVTTTLGAAGVDYVDDAADRAPGGRAGSRLSAGIANGLHHVLIFADTRVVAGEEVGPISELLAFVAFAPTPIAEGCDEAATILNLMNPACPPAQRPTELTQQDLAYLQALYRTSPDLAPTLQRSAIVGNIVNQLDVP
jgi:hypothetical protein